MLKLLTYIICFCSLSVKAQMNWLTSEQMLTKFSNEKKNILVYFKTDWCKFCKMQEQTVFNDSSITRALDSAFYAIKINAELDKDFHFFGRTYKGASQNDYSEFAEMYAKSHNKISFPTIVIFNEHLELVYKKSAFMSKEELRDIITSKKY